MNNSFNSPQNLKEALRVTSPENRAIVAGAVVNNLVLRGSCDSFVAKSKLKGEEVENLKHALLLPEPEASISEEHSEFEREQPEEPEAIGALLAQKKL